jgi:anaerobic magnesium-protoporphyrin IX monomethyl ester cyclase
MNYKNHTKILYKPSHTPNKNWVKEIDLRTLENNLTNFSAEKNDKRLVTLCRPFVALSKTTYSTPVTLPLGLAYVASVLEKAGYNTQIIDAPGEQEPIKIRRSKDELYNIQGLSSSEIIEKIKPETFIFGISLMFSQEWVLHKPFIEQIKKKIPNAIIVAGGEHVSAIPEYVLRDCKAIDYIIRGEGEFSMLEFTHNVFYNKSLKSIPGVCFIDENDKFIDNGYSKRIEYIDTLPRPAWHLLNVENYFNDYFTSGLARGRNMPILATRGCPFQCTFCSSPSMWTTRYVMRDPEDIVDEMEWLIEKYNATDFDFFDLTAIIKKSWILEFCNEIKKRDLNQITWQLPVGTRSEALDEETLKAIYETGCRFITYAPESGTDKTLKIIKKRVQLNKLLNSVKSAIKVGHTARMNFILAFPHETHFDCLRTIFFAIYVAARYGVSDINFAVFAPYPGSELFEQLKKKKKIKMNQDYFKKLLIQFDITKAYSYSDHVSGASARIYRVLGFSLSYLTIYLSRPKRIFKLLTSVFAKNFYANNLLEQRLYDLYVRFKIQKTEKKLEQIS